MVLHENDSNVVLAQQFTQRNRLNNMGGAEQHALCFVGVLPSKSCITSTRFLPVLRVLRKRAPSIAPSRRGHVLCSSGLDDSEKPGAVIPSNSEQQTQQPHDPVAVRVRSELAADGVNLDELLNAAKVVNLTRKLDKLQSDMSEHDPHSSEHEALCRKADKIRLQLTREKRLVMQNWLKQLFVIQAYLFVVIGGCLAYNAVPFVDEVPIVGRALGFWMTWLFTIPSLRARKGISQQEKSALNVAFLLTPVVNLIMPLATKDCGLIWASNMVILLGSYLRYGALFANTNGPDDGQATKNQNKERARIKGILKYLDWGSWR